MNRTRRLGLCAALVVTLVAVSERRARAEDAANANYGGNFSFGSYGRMQIASDLRGGEGRQANIVAYGTRIDEPSYVELQLERHDAFTTTYGDGAITTAVVATIAFAGPFFHETGDFAANIAVRNLYAETKGIFFKGFSAWVGSRMYRGDDVYLLDIWPLDNLNTVGGGIKLAFDTTSKEATAFALHVGMSRPNDPFDFQTAPSVNPSGVGSTDVITLDRPRIITSFKAQHIEAHDVRGFKAAIYGEYHAMSSGTSVFVDDNNVQQTTFYPRDHGTVVGAEVGVFDHANFVNVFLRYATGLAAYGDKTTPTAFTTDNTTTGAHEALAAISANYEQGQFGVLVGGYLRGFRDASGDPNSYNTFNEGTLVVRPEAWIGDHVGVAVEGSYQAIERAAIDVNGDKVRGSEWRLGVIPFLTPAGRGSYARPHFRVIYAVTFRDQGARDMYPVDDAFYRRSVEHYLGIGAEWWFNSSYR